MLDISLFKRPWLLANGRRRRATLLSFIQDIKNIVFSRDYFFLILAVIREKFRLALSMGVLIPAASGYPDKFLQAVIR